MPTGMVPTMGKSPSTTYFFGMFKKTMGMGLLSSGDATYQMTQAVPWGLSFPDVTFHHLWPVTFLF